MPNKITQSVYVKIAGIVALLGVLGTLIGYIISGVNFWNSIEGLPGKVDALELRLDSLQRTDRSLHDYIAKKKSSYAVGYRVKKVFDEQTGKYRKVRQYRDWKGYFNDIYIDHEATEFYGIDQYYYIDKDSQLKIYCW